MRCLAGDTERLQSLQTVSFRHRVGHVVDSLSRLSDRHRRDHRVGERIDGSKAVFILENGQVWRQIDGDATDVLAPPSGTRMRVTIEIGALGSYNLTIDGRKGLIKVNRLK